MFGTPVAAGVWQIGESGPANGSDMSAVVVSAPARVMMFPASSVDAQRRRVPQRLRKPVAL